MSSINNLPNSSGILCCLVSVIAHLIKVESSSEMSEAAVASGRVRVPIFVCVFFDRSYIDLCNGMLESGDIYDLESGIH